jgi:hypothetical protein
VNRSSVDLDLKEEGNDPVPNIGYSPFRGNEYVALSIIRNGSALPTARKRGRRALVVISAALLGYALTLIAILELG